jgi:hypothetical protein
MTQSWKSLVDQLLQDAQASGKFDNLPNKGKPLQFEDETHIPEDLRMAHRLLKEHDLVPDWIMLGKDIEAFSEKLLDNMAKGTRAYRGAVADAERDGLSFEKRQQAETTLRRAREAYEKAAAKLNREVLRYNLKVPPGFAQKPLFNLDRELERLLNEGGKR